MVAGKKSKVSRKNYVFNPVGYVKSQYRHYADIPRPHGKKGWTSELSQIILYPEHAGKLEGLEGYSHLIVLYWIHKAKEWRFPKDHGKPAGVRLFATRMPIRPNPIGLSVVKLVGFSAASGKIKVEGLDALDQSPVLDIKPYIPNFDSFPKATLPGWLKKHIKRHHHNQNGHK